MKKLLLGAAGAGAIALVFSLSATPALALNVSDYCAANGDFGFPSHGACVSAINKSVPQFCKDYLAADPAGFEALFGDTSVGTCVSTVRHEIKAL